MSEFMPFRIGSSVNLFVHRTTKFKTNIIKVFIHRDLCPETVTRNALLPFVMRRGSEDYPDTQEVWRALEELFGATLKADVIKMGERQLITFQMELANDKYTGRREDVMGRGLDLLAGLLTRPIFKEEYVEQEKSLLRRSIEGLINDKMTYAIHRCYEEMCREEPFGLFRYGRVDDLGTIDAAALREYYDEVISRSPIDFFVIGDVSPDEVYRRVSEKFSFPRGEVDDLALPDVRREVAKVRKVVEEQEVTQGKLTLGLRTNTARRDPWYYSLMVANGILGVFPHSKLFQNVREKASLAYYAFSRLEPTKGLMVISSGIEVENYEKAVKIIEEQLEGLKKGDISREEMAFTLKGLTDRLESIGDSPSQLINLFMEGKINGLSTSTGDIIAGIEGTDVDSVVQAAKRIELDTIYFLKDKGVTKDGADRQ